MREENYAVFDHVDDASAILDGQGFTGKVIQDDLGASICQVFINGSPWGPDYHLDSSGRLLEYSNCYGGVQWVGPRHEWDPKGNLISEEVLDSYGMLRQATEWDSQGRLVRSEEFSPGRSHKKHWTERGPWMWRTIPIPSELGETPDDNAWWQAKNLNSLVRDPQGLTTFHGEPYSGEAYVSLENRSLETRTFMEGFEEGPYTAWDPNKKIVLLGIRRHPFGPVGPWHKWDEQGRLISETIYDALGNKIIHRELNEAQNVVSQEHFDPVTLMTDPETGKQYPAPWL